MLQQKNESVKFKNFIKEVRNDNKTAQLLLREIFASRITAANMPPNYEKARLQA